MYEQILELINTMKENDIPLPYKLFCHPSNLPEVSEAMNELISTGQLVLVEEGYIPTEEVYMWSLDVVC